MPPFFLDEPWGILLGGKSELNGATPADGSGSNRLLTKLGQTGADGPRVSVASGKAMLPPASFPFLYDDTGCQLWHLPTCAVTLPDKAHYLAEILHDGQFFTLEQIGVVPRPTVQEEDSGCASKGTRLSSWIDWQIRSFQELHRLKENPNLQFDSATSQNLSRRTWEAASKVWLRTETDRARMALIVELSDDDSLRRSLESISSRPRRILERVRQETHVSRIQELDPACIRDYARRPGISAIEKAGARQTLMSVVRRERRNILENRVATWVMEACDSLARKYSLANSAFQADEKIANVARFGRRNVSWRSSEELMDVIALKGQVSTPNYPLQFDSRYKAVWATYLRILREKMVEDDAWSWQRALWSETARQLLGCCLHKICPPKTTSTPYYRGSIRTGLWTEPPIAPGPFSSDAWGNGWLVDGRDLESASGQGAGSLRKFWIEGAELFPGQKYIGLSGCDQFLYWDRKKHLILIWHFYHTALDEDGRELKKVLKRCSAAVTKLHEIIAHNSGEELGISGLLITADLNRTPDDNARELSNPVLREQEPVKPGKSCIYALTLPPDVDAWGRFSEDFEAGLCSVLEELLG